LMMLKCIDKLINVSLSFEEHLPLISRFQALDNDWDCSKQDARNFKAGHWANFLIYGPNRIILEEEREVAVKSGGTPSQAVYNGRSCVGNRRPRTGIARI